MKKTVSVMLTTGLLLGTVAYGALAQGLEKRPEQLRKFHPGGRNEFRMHTLNLTADQQKKMLEIRQQFEKDTQSLRFKMQKLQRELQELSTAKPLNQKAVDQKIKALAKLEVQLAQKAQKRREKMDRVLTAEQREEFAKNAPVCKGKGEPYKNGRFKGPEGSKAEIPGLTPQQQKRIAELREAFQKESQGLPLQLRQKEQQLRQLWESKKPNRMQILALTEEVTALRVKLSIQFEKMHKAMQDILTPEQRAQLEQKPQHHGRPGDGRWGRDCG